VIIVSSLYHDLNHIISYSRKRRRVAEGTAHAIDIDPLLVHTLAPDFMVLEAS
jgi:hypothetical protein